MGKIIAFEEEAPHPIAIYGDPAKDAIVVMPISTWRNLEGWLFDQMGLSPEEFEDWIERVFPGLIQTQELPLILKHWAGVPLN